MAALSQARVRVRAAAPGEGVEIAALWRELWEVHEQWGGYPGSRDPRVYADLAVRLDDDARLRAGHAVLGRHVHLVADLGGIPCGQVEGWLERHGVDASTPLTCEVRSLIVSQRARCRGAARALLDTLARTTRSSCRGGPCLLAAEVLSRNPANAFYERIGYEPVAWTARIEAAGRVDSASTPFRARLAGPEDSVAVLHLEVNLATRRRVAGDRRFDGPCPIDSGDLGALVGHLASHSGAGSLQDPATLVVVDGAGVPRAAASFTVHALEPPFVPVSRALLGRFALDEDLPASVLVAPMVAFARRFAAARGALHVELTDVSPPGTGLHDAVLGTGATAWSRLFMRPA
ncbi:MAG: GNAT family N-acetyltransferase [Polyangiaceae bacterium]